MKFIKNLIINALTAVGILIFLWLVISWADVLMHNDPITGDKQYMPGNAIVMMIGLTE
ncbi:hypothetical protein [Eubacterium sp. An11]|uniref:hypothetical protein n=1 Tax=Eubacterium sp. An11 TaxID=1965542 RepID=UPI0013A643E5|nr:hypothetical protein [Eubacterium sp. An11]